MGTNYYFMTKNKGLVEEYFPNESDYYNVDCGYEIVDVPYLGYEIHINKLSYGWSPLFQKHRKAYSNFEELELFYKNFKDDLEIFDEYGQQYSFDEYKDIVIKHSNRGTEYAKWVYEVDKVFGDKPSLHHVKCDKEEADFTIPIVHSEYSKTEKAAREKFHILLPTWMSKEHYKDGYYTRDPKYKFDWVRGDFG